MLSVRRAASAIEFYQRAFRAEELFRVTDDTGGVVARLSVDGAEFWIADESPKHSNFSPESLGGGSVRMVFFIVALLAFVVVRVFEIRHAKGETKGT